MKPLKQAISEYEFTHEDRAVALVSGSGKASIMRQLNKRGIERFGKDSGYSARSVKNLGDGVSIWILQEKRAENL